MKRLLSSVLLNTLLLILGLGCSNRTTSFDLPELQEDFKGKVFYNNKVDILFVIDNSRSMLQYQQNLSAKVEGLISTLNSLKMDYRVAITTTTMCKRCPDKPYSRNLIGAPSYLTSENINLLQQRLIVGDSGSDVETGLDALAWVTSSTYLSSVSSDFLRQDAFFSVIFISDEKDQSFEFGDPNSNNFVDYLDNLKPRFDNNSPGWIANYIGILTNQSCDILGGHVDIGYEFIKLVDASGGSKSSICSADLTAAVSNIKARIIDQLTAYRFKDNPNKATIQVTIDGTSILEDAVNGWTLESEIVESKTCYILKFHGAAVPAADQLVDVKYTAAGAS